MNRLVYFALSLPLLLAFITSADAGPACARRNQGTDACIQLCKDKWGWPGNLMGTDRWGQVVTKTVTNDMGAVLTQACRVRPTGLGSASSAATTTTSIASSTSPLLVPPPSSVAPANVIVSASAGTLVSAAPSVSLVAFTHSNSTSHTSSKASFTAFVVSTTAPPSSKASSTHSAEPSTTSSSKHTTTTHSTTSHSEAPSPETTVTKTSSKQPAATANSSGGSSSNNGSGSSSNNGNSGNSSNGASNSNSNSNGGSGNSGSSGNSSGSSGDSSGSTSQSDIDQYLQAHNSVRAQHGAAPLTWSDELAGKAQQWANNCVFQHSGGSLGPFGENLAAGTGSSYGIQSAVKSWTDEVSEYDPNNPQPSHFTQVVWKATTQVGCAVQSCNGIFAASFGPAKFFVCEYSPQGNVIGQFPMCKLKHNHAASTSTTNILAPHARAEISPGFVSLSLVPPVHQECTTCFSGCFSCCDLVVLLPHFCCIILVMSVVTSLPAFNSRGSVPHPRLST
ncbi:hypothetical protein C8Q73DRAFT_403625 [Cubamyces lactineus]|nr:hypothetical protein C8Q73DRAFT_403625 [Cubamyces lactineus]